MIIFIFLNIVFSNSFQYNFIEENTYDNINYFSIYNDTIIAIQDEFFENKINIRKIYNQTSNVNVLSDLNIKYYKNGNQYLLAQKEEDFYYYDVFTNQLEKIVSYEIKEDIKVFKFIEFDKSKHYLINKFYFINDSLYYDNVLDLIELNNDIFTLHINQNDLLIKKNNEEFKRLEYFQKSQLKEFENQLLLINTYNDRLLLNIINSSGDVVNNFWINTKINLFQDDINMIYYDLVDFNFKYLIDNKSIFQYIKKFDEYKFIDKLFIINHNNILNIIDLNDNLIARYENNSKIDDFIYIKNELYIQSNGKLQRLKLIENKWWLVEYVFVENIFYLLISILLIILLRLFIQYRQKQIIFHTIFDLPSSGLIIHLNDKGELINLNNFSRQLFSIPDSVKLGDYYKKYLSNDSSIEFSNLINKSLHFRQSFKQKINMKFENNIIEIMCNIIPIQNFAGIFRGLLITGTDITEELENKRMSNWAQLAHDMQTNLSTIKLNIEQIDTNSELDSERKNKILHQTNILIKRVRDIVTVGRSNELNKLNYSTEEIYNELILEFDLVNHPNIFIEKNIEKFSFNIDKDKIIRALRNAIENAIKIFENRKGTISIIFKRDNRFVYLIIKDDGEGMDNETLNKMKDPYFTTKSKKGGSGIGTIIMQKVMEQHGGEFIIKSQKNMGTEVIFKIPYIRS